MSAARCEQPKKGGAACPRPARYFVHLKLTYPASPHDTEQVTPGGRFVCAGGRSRMTCAQHLGRAVDRLTNFYREHRGEFVPEVRRLVSPS